MVGTRSLRVVFFGTPEFGVPTLTAIAGSRHALVAAVSQPDRPSGRGQRTMPGPVAALAAAHGIPVLQPLRLDRATLEAALLGFAPDIGVVAAYGKLLPEWLLALPPLGLINVHASLLPRYRGAAPVHRAVAAGELETGVTIMRVVRALDAGPMLAAVRRPIGADETSVEVTADLAVLGAALLVQTLDAIAAGAVDEVPQDESQATYAARLTRDDGAVDWHWPATRIHNHVRGMQPWPRLEAAFRSSRVLLQRSRATSRTEATIPGTVVGTTGEAIAVACGDGQVLELLALQPEGRRVMSALEFANGFSVRPGDRFA